MCTSITQFIARLCISLIAFTLCTSQLYALPQYTIQDETSELIESAITISAGWHHTCAVTASGGAKCWGDNDFGQLGNGVTLIDSSAPVNVTGLSNGIIAITTGYYHSCALTNVGGVKCWGRNNVGQLGNGTKVDSSIAVNVAGLSSGVTAISSKWNHTCALTSSAGVKCWGYNFYGGLGDGTNTDRSVPIDVVGLTHNVLAIAVGQYHACALVRSGGVKCWGQNSSGQLGDGTNTRHLTPVEVSGLNSGVSTIAAGYLYSCASMSVGGGKCWGYNFRGQLGNGTEASQAVPVDIVDLTDNISSITASEGHTCAITNSAGMKCWGGNNAGQLGDGTDINRSTPTDVLELSKSVTVIAVGDVHTCAVTGTGAAKCWGNHTFGQLGVGVGPPRNFKPLTVFGLNGVNISTTTTLTGAVGSSFVFSATGFIANTNYTVFLDKAETGLNAAAITPIGEVASDSTGSFELTLVSNEQTPTGKYRLTIGSAQSSFTIDNSSAIQQPTSQGSILQIPEKLNEQEVFLPLVRR